MTNNVQTVPIHEKLALTIREAAEYSNIGINKIDEMLRTPNCPFVLFVGKKKLVKRKEFEEFLEMNKKDFSSFIHKCFRKKHLRRIKLL